MPIAIQPRRILAEKVGLTPEFRIVCVERLSAYAELMFYPGKTFSADVGDASRG
jgi:hypothetical protein